MAAASNFDFLTGEWAFLAKDARTAEAHVFEAPRTACFYARFALEKAVRWLYDNDAYLRRPYEDRLGALLHEQTFKDNLRPGLFQHVRIVLLNGNHAAHKEAPMKADDAFHAVKGLFFFTRWLARSYSRQEHPKPGDFNPELIPDKTSGADKAPRSAAEVQKLQEKLEAAGRPAGGPRGRAGEDARRSSRRSGPRWPPRRLPTRTSSSGPWRPRTSTRPGRGTTSST